MNKIVAEIRTDEGIRFFRGGCCGTLRTTDAGGDKVVIELEQVGQIEGTFESTGRVYSAESNGLCRIEPCIAAMRGRNPDNPTSRESGLPTQQMLEIKDDGTSNTLTTVQKDNLVLEPHFRVRKLTPKECWRLMGFSDEDFDKAKAALNKQFYKGADRSNSQMYKQAGNSIVVNVLESIFKMMVE